MPIFDLSVTIEGDEKLDNKMRQMGYRAAQAEPALQQVLEVMYESERGLWEDKPWAPNADATLENKSSTEALVRTGALERSLTVHGDPNAIVEITPSTLKFGTKLWYAHFALGTIKQPPRELFKFKAAQKRTIREIIGQYIVGRPR